MALLYLSLLMSALVTVILSEGQLQAALDIEEIAEKQKELTKDMFEVIEERLSEQEAVLQEQITNLEARVAEVEAMPGQPRQPNNIEEVTPETKITATMMAKTSMKTATNELQEAKVEDPDSLNSKGETPTLRPEGPEPVATEKVTTPKKLETTIAPTAAQTTKAATAAPTTTPTTTAPTTTPTKSAPTTTQRTTAPTTTPTTSAPTAAPTTMAPPKNPITAAPPATTAAPPPATTAAPPPATTAASPTTTAAPPPATTKAPPPATTAAPPPATTAAPPAKTAAPLATTAASPTTTAASPTTTAASPPTTAASPTTTAASPTTTGASPTTSASPTTTTIAPTTTKTTTIVAATTTGSRYAVSCAAMYKNGYTTSGEYPLDPDGDGPLLPFTAYCDMETAEGATVIGHTNEQENIDVNGFDKAGSFVLEMVYSYETSLQQLGALADVSAECKQFVKYACRSSALMDLDVRNGLTYAWWVDRYGQKRVNWAGAPTDSKMCACGVTKTCFQNSETCNCDHRKSKNQSDEGFFDDKDLLPLMAIHLGDTGSKKERGAITVGKFICTGSA